MRIYLAFATLAVIAIASSFFPAHEAAAFCNPHDTPGGCLNAADKTCDTLGVTIMDGDQKNLIACLYDDAHAKTVWKTMTSGFAPPSTLAVNTQYTAEKDGLALVNLACGSGNGKIRVGGYVNDVPYAAAVAQGSDGLLGELEVDKASFMMPVRRGDKWVAKLEVAFGNCPAPAVRYFPLVN